MDTISTRRALLAALAALAALPRLALGEDSPTVEVFKNPSCGCCRGWVDHLQRAGFPVKVNEVADTSPVRRRLGMPAELASCHTAIVDGYIVEGHVPPADIRRLLAERPNALGLAVPGMPLGSPGMEAGGRRDPYDVLLVHRDGTTSVFAHH